MTLLVIDPYLVHAYWDLDPATIDDTAYGVLRVYDVTGQGTGHFDMPVSLAAGNWYIHLWTPERSYYAELGISTEGGFHLLARSNTVHTPRAWPVATVVDQWDAPADPVPAPIAASVESLEPVLQESPPPLPFEWGERPEAAPEPATPAPPIVPQPVDAPRLLRTRLERVYASLEKMAPPAPAILPDTAPAAHSDEPRDLTQLVEQHFSTGVSSKIPKPPA